MAHSSTNISSDSPDDESVCNRALWPKSLRQVADATPLLVLESDGVDTADHNVLVDYSPPYPAAVLEGSMSPSSWCISLALTSYEELTEHAEPGWAPAGPGWFDSSWLLRRGLEVREIEPPGPPDSVFKA